MIVVLVIVTGLLSIGAALALIRMARGPTVLDRMVATDVLVAAAVGAIAAEAAYGRHSNTLPILIALSILGFAASVSVARFAVRPTDQRHRS